MKRSTDRILTTHCGSLARPHDLLEMERDKLSGNPYDPEAFAERIRSSINELVAKQVACGVDVVNDGEQSKDSFYAYARERLSGLEETHPGPGEKLSGWLGGAVRLDFVAESERPPLVNNRQLPHALRKLRADQVG